MKRLKSTLILSLVAILLPLTACISSRNETTQSPNPGSQPSYTWQEEFGIQDCNLSTQGSSDYFILEPGFQLVLEGDRERLVITVLDETVEVDGLDTRVVEEREWRDDQLIEVSRNFFALCAATNDVFYFGEEVDMYSGGQLASHSGAWRAGENDARAGLIMPGEPVVGMKYYQEVAPGVAMDRAEVISLDEPFETPAEHFDAALKTREGTALNPFESEIKRYAREIGLIQDQNLLLTAYGFNVSP